MFERPRAGAIAQVVFSASLLLALAVAPASARHHQFHGVARRGGVHFAGLTDPDKDAALIVDGTNNKVLYARNADQIRHPASLTKMMTLYLLFEKLRNGQMTMQTELPVSEHAAEQHPTKMYLRPGQTIPVEAAIKAIVIRSANDVAVAIAESIGGTESHFAELMTAKARQLGMSHTFYHNASGLPDQLQVTTAQDLAILAHHLAYDFPQYFPYFATPYFTYRGETYQTHDNLIGRYDGADGIKTGFTEASGFNLVSSVVRDGHHIVGIVMGGNTAHMRDREMVRLLDDTFARIATDPTLVARTRVPWQVAHPQLVADLGTPAMPGAAPGGDDIRIQPNGSVEDEDSAEARQDPQDDTAPLRSNVIAATPKPQPAVAPTRPAVVAQAAPPPPPPRQTVAIPSIRPTPRPTPPKQTITAALAPPPGIKPTPRAVALGEGDIDTAPIPVHRNKVASVPAPAPSFTGIRDWSIQIGAFNDAASAKAQLASYAEHSLDVLGQAQRIIAPFQSVDGHTLYRARFGPFVEAEARAVCQRLTERGQTCFAATGR
ncbi:MAG TPA: D-alanyl-D-alanine carboxypeptidase [Rhizomicrobium sp.]|jgi:D-alanyl-D-alanine carboxypeptidase